MHPVDRKLSNLRIARAQSNATRKKRVMRINPHVEDGERVFRTKGMKVKLSAAHRARLRLRWHRK